MSKEQDSGIREQLKELAEVSLDLDRHSQMSKTANHPVQVQQMRMRIDELTAKQSSLMEALVSQHPDAERKANFHKLQSQVDALKDEIRGCEEKDRLVDLEAQIEKTVDSWIHAFQVIVSELAGVSPPTQAVYDK